MVKMVKNTKNPKNVPISILLRLEIRFKSTIYFPFHNAFDFEN